MQPQTYRYFAEISFKGTCYHGWQIQKNAASVQKILNEKVSFVLNEPVSFTGAGRTDTGVHAGYFVAHFDSARDSLYEDNRLLQRINGFLPCDIAIHSFLPVMPDAHARFSALSRTYEYRVMVHKDPFWDEFAFPVHFRPALAPMREACAILMEYQDFSSFCKAGSDAKTHRCRIMKAEWVESGALLIFRIQADRFLRNMVRAITGTMFDIGKGCCSPDDFRKIITGMNRSDAGESVPAKGLCLTDIAYPDRIFLHGSKPRQFITPPHNDGNYS